MLKKIALTKIKGVGPKTARTLLTYFGSVDNIFDASKKQLLSIPGIRKATVESIFSKNYMHDAERELAFVEKHNIEMLWAEDATYPRRLTQCEDAPLLMYYKGTVDLNPRLCVSIVGTRNATVYGKRICEELVSTLQEYDIQIVSGLAYGIDVQAHRLALKHHIPTIGVLGHGLDRIYPSAHRDVASRMLENGGLLTEYPSETIPDRSNFPARNRIIAGLADVTIVVEAAKKGGALITAEIANSYNRDVCAFPGGIDQEYSAGCNYLIKTHRAHLIRHADDLIYLMGWERPKSKQEGMQLPLLTTNLSKDEQRVYDFLQEKEQASVDEIALHLDWPMNKLAMILLEMEMNSILLSLPGKIYRMH
ncbi:DNA-processing protein DprA [Sphingobacterium gobiense]